MKIQSSKFLNALLLLILIVGISACSKKDSEPAKTTYQIINNVDRFTTTSDTYLNGSLWDVVVYSYTGLDIVRQDNIISVSPEGGKSDLIEVPSTYEKVKVSFKLLPRESANYSMASNYRRYIVAFTTLEIGKNNIITINGSTMSGPTLSISGPDTKLTIGKAFENISLTSK